MSRFIVLLGGDLVRTPRLDALLAGARIVAADAGIRHAETLGVVPELWLGDFDSVPDRLAPHLRDVPRETFPVEKDQTDGELAVSAALQRGATELILAGAFGGPRSDHAFLHMTLAMRLADDGTPTLLTSGAQEGTPLLAGRTTRFDYTDGTVFSVLAFSALSNLSVRGAKWPLEGVEVPFGTSLTLSNTVRGTLQIGLNRGRALLLAHPFPQAGF
ncbi:thiamine diphosphokinase [Oryzicola mucosus]|uniref:Thiamine diphosphokinase n=1 Tax=Oryzicola mucosus TaxID=2767425 RepID=A0A8J6PIM0_9HYPH|nr:thiamine diphosphokinase [Oryzicola mucosus]MBD0414216.1 thiamine diphosphokinase [Oryzicola mucosus]